MPNIGAIGTIMFRYDGETGRNSSMISPVDSSILIDRVEYDGLTIHSTDVEKIEWTDPPLPSIPGTQILATVGGVDDVWLILAGSSSGPLWKTVVQPDKLIGSIYYDHGITKWRLK